jgi:hypothetical protein
MVMHVPFSTALKHAGSHLHSSTARKGGKGLGHAIASLYNHPKLTTVPFPHSHTHSTSYNTYRNTTYHQRAFSNVLLLCRNQTPPNQCVTVLMPLLCPTTLTGPAQQAHHSKVGGGNALYTCLQPFSSTTSAQHSKVREETCLIYMLAAFCSICQHPLTHAAKFSPGILCLWHHQPAMLMQ